MANGMKKDWRELCIAVINEQDSAKLSSLVRELVEALDKGEQNWRQRSCLPDAIVRNPEAA